jgi:hypothetical protein
MAVEHLKHKKVSMKSFNVFAGVTVSVTQRSIPEFADAGQINFAIDMDDLKVQGVRSVENLLLMVGDLTNESYRRISSDPIILVQQHSGSI